VVHGQIDTGSLQDSTVFGHAVNLANRLQEAARPGTVLVSEAVHRLTRSHFGFSYPVRLQLRGIDRPVVGYEVTGPRLRPLPRRGQWAANVRLVGRDEELEKLSNHLQRLQVDRNGLLMLVSGPPGIGKTRLVEEALSSLGSQCEVVRTTCSPAQGSGYALLRTLLEHLCGILPEEPIAAREGRLESLLAAMGTLADAVRPPLALLLGREAADSAPPGDAQQQQRRIMAAFRRLFAWLARRRPLVLALDDLQWADESSLAVLAHSADLVTEIPLAIIAIARTPVSPDLEHALLQTGATSTYSPIRLQLSPLERDESEELASLLLPAVSRPGPLLRRIAERSGGNPLLTEELVRMLLDDQVLERSPAGWKLADGWVDAVEQIPETVTGLILGRYDRLPANLKRLLIQAAVLGPRFTLPLLLALTGSDEESLRAQLRVLEQADYVQRAAGGDRPVFFFRHSLVQEAVYQTVLRSELGALHAKAAEAVERLADNLAVDSDALIGYHLEKAHSPRALPHLTRAARQAADRYANQEAIDLFRRARAVLGAGEPPTQFEVDTALGLAEVLGRVNQLDEALTLLEEAREEAHGFDNYRLGDVHYQLGRVYAAQGDATLATSALQSALALLNGGPAIYSRSDVEREIGWVFCRQGRMETAQEHALRALKLASDEQDRRALAGAYNLLIPIHYWAGRLPQAVESARQALTMRDQLGDVWGSASSQTNLAGLYYRLGRWDEAEPLMRQAVFVRQEIGDHQGVVLSANILGLLLLEAGRYDEALNWLEQAFAALEKQGAPPDLTSQLYGNRGLLWLRTGELTMARGDLETCLESAAKAGNRDLAALASGYLAETDLAEGKRVEAVRRLEEADASCAEGPPEVRAELLRVRSLAHRAYHEWAAAMEANGQALALYQQIGNRYELAHLQLESAELDLARHAAQAGKPPSSEHVAELRHAIHTFRELGASTLAVKAEETLARLTALLGPSAAATAVVGRKRPVAVVHFALSRPVVGPDTATQEATEQMISQLARTARLAGAAAVLTPTGTVALLSEMEPVPGDSLPARAIRLARNALEAATQLNQGSLRQRHVAVPVSVGIAIGKWNQFVHRPEAAANWVARSQAGRHAAALAGRRSSGAIMLSESVALQVQERYALEAVDVGAGEPAYLLGPPRAESPLPHPLPGASLRLIGRHAEMTALRAWIDRTAARANGQVCYVEAEAGMGKSRLVEELLAYAQPAVRCYQGKCEAFRSNISFWPLIEMLGRSAGNASEHGPETESESGRQLRNLLDLRPADSADEQLARHLGPAEWRSELLGRVRTFLISEAAVRPVLLLFEDIHFIDLASLELIDYILPLTFQASISVMLVARAEMPGPHRALVAKAERVCREGYLRVSFGGLDLNEGMDLARELLQTPELPTKLQPRLEPFAAHPLSLEEGLRFLIERQWLLPKNGSWRWAEPPDHRERAIPDSYKNLVLARLDMLDKQTLHLFQAASVLGEEVDRLLLSRVAPDPDLPGRLSELVERGWLIAPTPERPTTFRFKHTLTRETVYATLMTSKRRLLHQRAAEAIRTLYQEEQEHTELLAHHYAESSQREEALHFAVRAAEKSAARFALSESASHYARAEQLLSPSPEKPRRTLARILLGMADVHLLRGEPSQAAVRANSLLADPDSSAGPRAQAYRRLADAQRQMGEFRVALESYQRAADLLALSDEPPAAAEAEHWAIQVGLARAWFDMRENDLASEQAAMVTERIDRRSQPRLAAEAFTLLGGISRRSGDLAGGRQMVQRSLEINRSIGNRSGVAADYTNLGTLVASLGHEPDEARDWLRLGLEMSRELADSRGTAIALNNLGLLARNQGLLDESQGYLRQAVDTARHSDLTQVLAQSLSNLGQVLTSVGSLYEALETLGEAESLAERYGFRNLLSEVRWKQADCLLQSGDLAAAEAAGMAARALAAEVGSHDLAAQAERVLERINRMRGTG